MGWGCGKARWKCACSCSRVWIGRRVLIGLVAFSLFIRGKVVRFILFCGWMASSMELVSRNFLCLVRNCVLIGCDVMSATFSGICSVGERPVFSRMEVKV